MPIRNAKLMTWRPAGLSDTVDGTTARPGSMSILQNLVDDPTTRYAYVCRPAATLEINSDASGTMVAVVYIEIGNVVYGLQSTAGGVDTPFAYNLLTSAFTAVSGWTAGNTPVTQNPYGDWTPPTVASLGQYVIFTHPGFTGNPRNGSIGWINISVPTAPVWGSGDLSINGLFGIPVAVAVFGGRAYYAVGNATVASDEYLPLQRTNAEQVLTFGDSSPITALAGLPLNNQLGGVLQALIVFKAANNLWQVTGDYSLSTWATNTLNVATGTLAPNSVTPTPQGLAFIAPDGVRVIDFSATVSDPIGVYGEGVALPFVQAGAPSRIIATYNVQVLRIAVQVSINNNVQIVEYWYNFTNRQWTGPHTLPTTFIIPYKNTFLVAFANTFLSNTYHAGLFVSDSTPTLFSEYEEFGSNMLWAAETSLLPENQTANANALILTSVETQAIGATPVITVSFYSETDNLRGTYMLSTGQANSLWDSAIWDENYWDGSPSYFFARPVFWANPFTFRQGYLELSGTSAPGFRFGSIYMTLQELAYDSYVPPNLAQPA